jgi:hypothetical protein
MTAEQHQHAIAWKTLSMSELGARLAGGPTLPEAIKIIRKAGKADIVIKAKMKASGHSDEAIAELFNRD